MGCRGGLHVFGVVGVEDQLLLPKIRYVGCVSVAR